MRMKLCSMERGWKPGRLSPGDSEFPWIWPCQKSDSSLDVLVVLWQTKFKSSPQDCPAPSAHVPSPSYLIKHNLGAAAVKDFANKIKALNQLTLKQKARPWWAWPNQESPSKEQALPAMRFKTRKITLRERGKLCVARNSRWTPGAKSDAHPITSNRVRVSVLQPASKNPRHTYQDPLKSYFFHHFFLYILLCYNFLHQKYFLFGFGGEFLRFLFLFLRILAILFFIRKQAPFL